MKIMASGPITSWQTEENEVELWQILFSWSPKSLWTVMAAMKLKDTWKKSYEKPRQCIKKQRHHFAGRVKAMILPVVMYGCESWAIKKAECQRIGAFKLCWRRLFSFLDSKEIKSVNPKGNQLYSLEELMLKLKRQYFGHLMRRVNSLKKTLMLGSTENSRRREWQRMRWLDSITDSMDMSLSKIQEIVKDREAWMLQCIGIERVTWLCDWTTKWIHSVYYSQGEECLWMTEFWGQDPILP